MPTVISETLSWRQSGLSSQRNVVVLEVVIVVVIVVGILAVLVHDVLAVEVIGERVAPCFLFFGVGHSVISWRRRRLLPARMGAGQCSFTSPRVPGEEGASFLNELSGSRRDGGAGRNTVGSNCERRRVQLSQF